MSTLIPKILFEDIHLIVLSKPAGLLSQGEHTGSENVVDWLRGYLGRNYVGMVHRLDRNTSGVMVVAKRSKAANRLSKSLQDSTLKRSYLAWLEGTLEKTFCWKHLLEKDRSKNVVRVVRHKGKGVQEARLEGTVETHGEWKGKPLTLVQFRLETGRSHQIRVQSSYEGFPLLGDQKYGSKTAFSRPALHSYWIQFPHPMSGEILELKEDLPQDLAQIKRTT